MKVVDLTISEFLVSGVIGEEGTDFKAMGDFLSAANGEDVIIKINSPGGNAFEGVGMYNLLKAYTGHVRIEVLGLAASAASIIAMAGNESLMAKTAQLMIHNPSTAAFGGSKDMKKAGDNLDNLQDVLADIYIARSHLEKDKIIEMMDAETWLALDDAKGMGFIDGELKMAALWNVAGIEKFNYINLPKQNRGEHAMLNEIKTLLGVDSDAQVMAALKVIIANSAIVETLQAELVEAKKQIELKGSIIDAETKMLLTQANGQIDALKADQEILKIQAKKNERKEFEAEIKELSREGYTTKAMADLLMATYDEKGREAYDSQKAIVVAGDPQYKILLGDAGSSFNEGDATGDAIQRFEAKIDALRAEKSISYTKAYDLIKSTDAKLMSDYENEVTAQEQK